MLKFLAASTMRPQPGRAGLPRAKGAALWLRRSVAVAARVSADMRVGVAAGLSVLALLMPSGSPLPANGVPSANTRQVPLTAPLRQADFGRTATSAAVQRIAQWSAATQDHATMPFVVVDKQAARLYVFDAHARLQADTAVLLGSALGDHSVPGIGDKAIADVQPDEPTAPAGRFQGQIGRNLTGEDVVWVDDDAASMHRVRNHQASERRLQRLTSEAIDDNRISYGCINVPAVFFDAHLLPVFSTQAAVIYVLPDPLTLEQVFGLQP